MKKRDWIYVGLLAFVAFGIVVDFWIWPSSVHTSLTANDIVQMAGFLFLCCWWEIEDAAIRGGRPSSLARVFTILVAPIGLAIYFYQSRRWKSATVGFVAFLLGIVATVIVTTMICDWLSANGVLPTSGTL